MEGDFVQLTRRRDLLALLDEEAQALRDALEPCGAVAVADGE